MYNAGIGGSGIQYKEQSSVMLEGALGQSLSRV